MVMAASNPAMNPVVPYSAIVVVISPVAAMTTRMPKSFMALPMRPMKNPVARDCVWASPAKPSVMIPASPTR